MEHEQDRQCCGKCEKPAGEATDWRTLYMREVEGLNSEGDPIGGEPGMGMRQTVERQNVMLHELARRLRTSDAIICVLLNKAGGEVVLSKEDMPAASCCTIASEPSEDRKKMTLRLIQEPRQTSEVEQ